MTQIGIDPLFPVSHAELFSIAILCVLGMFCILLGDII